MVVTAAIAGGAIAAGGSVLGGSISASAANRAADLQRQATLLAMQRLDPFREIGQNAASQLGGELSGGQLGQPAPLDEASIENMPGYKFVRDQGLRATQNAQTAGGLGISGPALDAAAQYATGLAASNFQNYFSDYWANQNNRFNMLYGLASAGQNAAAGQGNQALTGAAGAGSAIASGGTSLGQALNNAGNTAGQNALLAGLLSRGAGGGSTIATDPNILAAQASSPYPGTFYGVPT
jgi:hypothetical protein